MNINYECSVVVSVHSKYLYELRSLIMTDNKQAYMFLYSESPQHERLVQCAMFI